MTPRRQSPIGSKELAAEIRKIIENPAYSLEHLGRYVNGYREEILAALETYEPWVSVEERRPESGSSVLASVKGKMVVYAFYSEKTYEGREWREWFVDDRSSPEDDEVTHWKPLPKPPEGE